MRLPSALLCVLAASCAALPDSPEPTPSEPTLAVSAVERLDGSDLLGTFSPAGVDDQEPNFTPGEPIGEAREPLAKFCGHLVL